jgi:hypothetical protein
MKKIGIAVNAHDGSPGFRIKGVHVLVIGGTQLS